MRILFVSHSLDCGGAERQLTVLARGLRQRGHEVAVAVFYPEGALESELRETGVSVISLAKRGRWDVFGFLMRLNRTVRQLRPDVLHTYIVNFITVLVRPFWPAMRIVWGVRSSYMDFSRYDWLCRACNVLECLALHSADLIIANSHAGRRHHLAHGYPEKKTVVIPNGIDTDRFRSDPDARERIRAEWGVSKEKELIGLVGRLDPMKDHETFLQSASLLARERRTARFVCVGDGRPEYREALQERASFLGLSNRILWVGRRSDIEDVYNALDVLVNCSLGEGFPNVLGEAMACGIPCVATDVGDSALIVGTLGLVVRPQDPVALKNGIQRVLDAKPPSTEIRRSIVEQFSVKTLVLATERELHALCRPAIVKAVLPRQRTLAK